MMENVYSWARSFMSVLPQCDYLTNSEHQLSSFLFNPVPANSVADFFPNSNIAPQSHFFINTTRLRSCTLKVNKKELGIISSDIKCLVYESLDDNVLTRHNAPFYSVERKQKWLPSVSSLSSLWACKVLELMMLSDRHLEEV